MVMERIHRRFGCGRKSTASFWSKVMSVLSLSDNKSRPLYQIGGGYKDEDDMHFTVFANDRLTWRLGKIVPLLMIGGAANAFVVLVVGWLLGAW